jgi:hypothetical protein
VEIRSQAVSPESTLGGEEAGISAKATPAMNKLINNNRNRITFISFPPDIMFLFL